MHRLLIALIVCVGLSGVARAEGLDEAAAARFAQLALDCVHKEYPNKIAHYMTSDADLKPPRQLTPAFYGCYDWHSTVHGHWLLARVIKLFPHSAVAQKARAALALSLTQQNIAAEVAYITAPGRESFERPYGLAWLLQLAAELRSTDDRQFQEWSANLAPLEAAAAKKLTTWLPKLSYPIRIGEHDQTAFAFGLTWDWARATKNSEMEALLREKAKQFYLGDKNCPLAYEPSGQDFLSPCLAEADFVRRVLAPAQFAQWLTAFLPQIPKDGSTAWLQAARITDRSDPKLAHLDRLNLSRAWMLEGIAEGLPAADARRGALRASAALHRNASLGSVTSEHYVGSHWLGTFALYGASRNMQSGAAMKTAKVVAINVLLLPDQSMSRRAKEINGQLRQSYPQGFALDASHVPHISILHRYVSAETLPQVFAAVEQVATKHSPVGVTLTASGLESSPWEGHQVTSIKVQKTPELSALQDELVAALRPYAVESGGADAFVTTGGETAVGDQTIDYVRTFVEKQTGENFKPHITAGISDSPPASDFKPMQFKVAALVVYQLGNVGTARKELWRSSSGR
ncbi:MAG TPA: DUF2891 family protein [Steroidobacteraceae bacterium]|jgi:hypothetical protein